jgi:hypothetical protein
MTSVRSSTGLILPSNEYDRVPVSGAANSEVCPASPQGCPGPGQRCEDYKAHIFSSNPRICLKSVGLTSISTAWNSFSSPTIEGIETDLVVTVSDGNPQLAPLDLVNQKA